MTIRYLPSFYFEPLRMRFEYMNRIASRGGPVHRTEKTGSGPLRSRIVSYCSIGIYVPDARFSPSSVVSPTTPRNYPRVRSSTATAPFPLRDCRKDQDKVISYFRLSLRFSNTRTFGNWRTVESISTTYLFAKLLELYVIARYASDEVSNDVSKKNQ